MMHHDFSGNIQALIDNQCDSIEFRGQLTKSQVVQLAAALKKNQSLVRMYFRSSDFPRGGLTPLCQALHKHPKLSCLHINKGIITKVDESIGALIGANPKITTLGLTYCDIDTADMKLLFKDLVSSNVSNFELKLANANQAAVLLGAIELIRLNQFNRLILPLKELTIDSAEKLAAVLQHNTSLKCLEFDAPRGHICSGALLQFLKGLQAHNALCRLVLGYIDGDADYEILLKFLTVNAVIQHISINNLLTPGQLEGARDALNQNHSISFFGYNDKYVADSNLDEDRCDALQSEISAICIRNAKSHF
jgi:hypothetical protein